MADTLQAPNAEPSQNPALPPTPSSDQSTAQAPAAPVVPAAAPAGEAQSGGDKPAEIGGIPAEESLNETNKVRICIKALRSIERDIANVIRLLESNVPLAEAAAVLSAGSAARAEEMPQLKPLDGRVIEGVFDGQNMVGSDGKIYTVPANYASKSKLVEGDLLKLTITPKGSFIYKQIGPIERSRVIGSLGFDPTINEFYVTTENRRWNVLKASVTYFKGEAGDEVVLLVPKSTPSKWGAAENIIKKNPLA